MHFDGETLLRRVLSRILIEADGQKKTRMSRKMKDVHDATRSWYDRTKSEVNDESRRSLHSGIEKSLLRHGCIPVNVDRYGDGRWIGSFLGSGVSQDALHVSWRGQDAVVKITNYSWPYEKSMKLEELRRSAPPNVSKYFPIVYDAWYDKNVGRSGGTYFIVTERLEHLDQHEMLGAFSSRVSKKTKKRLRLSRTSDEDVVSLVEKSLAGFDSSDDRHVANEVKRLMEEDRGFFDYVVGIPSDIEKKVDSFIESSGSKQFDFSDSYSGEEAMSTMLDDLQIALTNEFMKRLSPYEHYYDSSIDEVCHEIVSSLLDACVGTLVTRSPDEDGTPKSTIRRRRGIADQYENSMISGLYDALEWLNDNDVIWGDLHENNVMKRRDGQWVLSDVDSFDFR